MDTLYDGLYLSTSRNDIRLLVIRPSSSQLPELCCTLVVKSLNDNPYYRAHSYRWGNPVKTELIRVNDRRVMIPMNLMRVLNSIQRNADAQPLETEQFHWLDYLCIDQNNVHEKNAQVPRMGIIYSSAISVIAHVGPAADDSDLAMETIHEAGAKICMFALTTMPALDDDPSFSHSFEACARNTKLLVDLYQDLSVRMREARTKHIIMDCLENLIPHPSRGKVLAAQIAWASLGPSDARYRAVQAFLKREFWRRIWIFQELHLGKDVFIVCGNAISKLEYLLAVIFVMYGTNQLEGLPMGLRGEQFRVELYRKADMLITAIAGLIRPLPLMMLFEELRLVEAALKQDHVYGLLGAASDAKELGIVVDYNKTLEQICTDMAKPLIFRDGVEALTYTGEVSDIPYYSGVPSWVTFYSMIGIVQNLRFRKLRPNYSSSFSFAAPFSAAAHTAQTFNASNFQVSGCLKVRGCLVDTIELGVYLDHNAFEGVEYEGLGSFVESLDAIDMFAELAGGVRGYVNDNTAPLWWLPVLHSAPHAIDSASRREYQEYSEKLQMSYLSLQSCRVGIRDRKYVPSDRLGQCRAYRLAMRATHTKILFHTSGKQLGIGSIPMTTGDSIAIFHGGKMPFALRSLPNGRYRLLGEVYVLGRMHGEFMRSHPTSQEFLLE